jgi:hypothetical protein
MDMPDFAMYAVLENNTVIDCGFDANGIIQSPLTQKLYDNNYQFIAMTIENSPAEIGMKYKENKFYFEGEINA